MEDVLHGILKWKDKDEADLYHNLISTCGMVGGFIGVILGQYLVIFFRLLSVYIYIICNFQQIYLGILWEKTRNYL